LHEEKLQIDVYRVAVSEQLSIQNMAVWNNELVNIARLKEMSDERSFLYII